MKGRYCKTQEKKPLADVSDLPSVVAKGGKRLCPYHSSQTSCTPTYPVSTIPFLPHAHLSPIFSISPLWDINRAETRMSPCCGRGVTLLTEFKTSEPIIPVLHYQSGRNWILKNQSFPETLWNLAQSPQDSVDMTLTIFILPTIYPAFLVSPSKLFSFHSTIMDWG